MENEKFAKMLQDLIFAKGLTDALLGERIGKDRITVWRWRTEGRLPDPPTLKAVCDALGCTKEEATELVTAAGYVVTFGQPENPGQPLDTPGTAEPKASNFDHYPLLATAEPNIIPFALAESILNPPKPPEVAKRLSEPTPPQPSSKPEATSNESNTVLRSPEIEKFLGKIKTDVLNPITKAFNQPPAVSSPQTKPPPEPEQKTTGETNTVWRSPEVERFIGKLRTDVLNPITKALNQQAPSSSSAAQPPSQPIEQPTNQTETGTGEATSSSSPTLEDSQKTEP